MKFFKAISLILLSVVLFVSFCACDGTTPSTGEPSMTTTTEATTTATPTTEATTATPTTEATTAPYVSNATSLFTLFSEIDYGDFTPYTGILPPGATPVEYLPPANEELIGKKMTVNPTLEQKQIYFYYCKNAQEQTERLALIFGGSDGKYPLLIIADVTFGSADAFKAVLEQKRDFEINVVATANLCNYEANVLTLIAINAASQSNETQTRPAGVVEYYGVVGGDKDSVIAPRTAPTGFHTVFRRHFMNEVMGIYVMEADD